MFLHKLDSFINKQVINNYRFGQLNDDINTKDDITRFDGTLWIRIRIELNCWIRVRIRIVSIRIHNLALKFKRNKKKNQLPVPVSPV
jgi:hypothetical protein